MSAAAPPAHAAGAALLTRGTSLLARLLDSSVEGYSKSLRFLPLGLVYGSVAGGLFAAAAFRAAARKPDPPARGALTLGAVAAGAVAGVVGAWTIGYALGFSAAFARSDARGEGARARGLVFALLAKMSPLTPPLTLAWWLVRD